MKTKLYWTAMAVIITGMFTGTTSPVFGADIEQSISNTVIQQTQHEKAAGEFRGQKAKMNQKAAASTAGHADAKSMLANKRTATGDNAKPGAKPSSRIRRASSEHVGDKVKSVK